MRRLACGVLVLAACGGERAAPVPVAETGADVDDVPLTVACPVGDHSTQDVYAMFQALMVEAPKRTRAEAKQYLAADAEKERRGDKPDRAMEGEEADLARRLCASEARCEGIGIYDAVGVGALVAGERLPPLGFADDRRWADLTDPSRAEGIVVPVTCEEARALRVPCDGMHVIVGFAVRDEGALRGFAACFMRVAAAK